MVAFIKSVNTSHNQERAVLYARVSRDDRDTDARNLKGQLKMGRKFANRKNYIIVAELAEDARGVSGAEINLPQLNTVRTMAKNGEFDVLIVRELDRLSRNLAKQLIIEEELNRYGVRVEYVLVEYDDSPEGRLNKHMRATIAEYEREKINERMVRGRQNKVKEGKVLVYRHPPYGYRINNDQLEIYEPEACVVRQMFQWYLEDGLTMWAIGDKLDEMGVPVPSNSIKKNTIGWMGSSIGKMLKNETYAGVWHFGKENGRTRKKNPREQWIPVRVPAIISRETWEAAQKKRIYNSQNAKRNRKYNYLFRQFQKNNHPKSRGKGADENKPFF